ncbi:MAG TPA: DUF3179 domain-containing (seleno)protein [Ferruginibacter sp.]|nr:DUF3179 domain-containing (seleno)protein [Ferruginibacter sp.]
MKKWFYIGFFGWILFEIANVYFIMPMPGSQRMHSVELAYCLYSYRWGFRILFALLLLIGLMRSTWKRKGILVFGLLFLGALLYVLNFKMAADAMFQQPVRIALSTVSNNRVDRNRLVIGVAINGIARAYPIQFLGYHHFVYDTVNAQPILVTYCTVCRTGRVFDPRIDTAPERFRLVGMDHFNAMIEDERTGSWWRQSTGEAIVGKRKGERLREIQSTQTSLDQWIRLYPETQIMQADPASQSHYDSSFLYETGKSKQPLTGTDSRSWNDKSWVVGLKLGNNSIAIDWNDLLQQRLIQTSIHNKPVFVVLASDQKSFFAYQLESSFLPSIQKDTLLLNGKRYLLNGRGIDTAGNLQPVPAYQEFWHSWKTFQPNTQQYRKAMH